MPSFYEVITQAVAYFTEHGYSDAAALEEWMRRVRDAAHREMVPQSQVERQLRAALAGTYQRLVERGALLKRHPGAEPYTLARVAPRLRAELDRRILASAQLIRLNRTQAVEDTLRRFAGWATSIPPGGSDAVDRNPVKTDIRKALASLPFRERRVAVDQAHKFSANLSEILAADGGAIAGVWRHHHSNSPRPTHVERAGKVFLLHGSWAHERGLVKSGSAGYYDDVPPVASEVFCRCTMTWLHGLRRLPADMLTSKGRDELARIDRIAA